MIGGASMLRLTAADEAHLAKRLAEVRARLRAAVTRDETFRPSGSLKVLRSGHEPLIGLGRMPIVTVTIVDASRVQRPASDLAERWIESLGVAMSRLPVGDAWDEAWFRVERPSGKPWEPRLLAAAILEVGELVPFGGTGIRASLHGHLLRLTGEVASLGEKLALGRNARNLPGVRDIDNRLQVRGDAPGKDLPPEATWLPAATLSPAGLATGGHR